MAAFEDFQYFSGTATAEPRRARLRGPAPPPASEERDALRAELARIDRDMRRLERHVRARRGFGERLLRLVWRISGTRAGRTSKRGA